jgi:hypothetical protein
MSFKSVQKKIAGQGHSMESAGAILADASRHASAAAKRANPKLNRVKGKMHGGGVVPSDGTYELKAGEKVVATGGYGKTMIESGAERPMRPMPTNRECVAHQVVEAHGATTEHNVAGEPGHVQAGSIHRRSTSKSMVAERHVK